MHVEWAAFSVGHAAVGFGDQEGARRQIPGVGPLLPVGVQSPGGDVGQGEYRAEDADVSHQEGEPCDPPAQAAVAPA